MEWDYVEYRVAESFLPALINSDYSGLTNDAEVIQYGEFLARVYEEFGGVGHFSVEEDSQDFKRCEVCGLLAMVETVRWNFKVNP